MSYNSVGDYISGLKNCLDEIKEGEVQAIVDIIINAYEKNRSIFIVGNGGSASTASHFACDLGKGTAIEGKNRLKVMSLTDNIALMTAISNDISYTSVFKEQLINLLNEGDVVICISASGNSPNVIEAAEYARSKGAVTIGLLGFGGGELRQLTNQAIILSAKDYGQVEDAHMVLVHLISAEVKKRIGSGDY